MNDHDRAERCRADLDHFAALAAGPNLDDIEAAFAPSPYANIMQAKLEIMRIVSDSGESRRRK